MDFYDQCGRWPTKEEARRIQEIVVPEPLLAAWSSMRKRRGLEDVMYVPGAIAEMFVAA